MKFQYKSITCKISALSVHLEEEHQGWQVLHSVEVPVARVSSRSLAVEVVSGDGCGLGGSTSSHGLRVDSSGFGEVLLCVVEGALSFFLCLAGFFGRFGSLFGGRSSVGQGLLGLGDGTSEFSFGVDSGQSSGVDARIGSSISFRLSSCGFFSSSLGSNQDFGCGGNETGLQGARFPGTGKGRASAISGLEGSLVRLLGVLGRSHRFEPSFDGLVSLLLSGFRSSGVTFARFAVAIP